MCRRRLAKMFVVNLWRIFKYYLISLASVFIMYSLFSRLFQSKNQTTKSSIDLKYVTVHFDLKGSPPKMSYLVSLLPFLSMYGVNSILMEYEDMFPYIGSIVNISSENCYKREELKWFLHKAKTLNMEIIPLVQTFGHMEYVLKLKEFAHLREEHRFPTDICPSNPSSAMLITTMLKQIIDFHTTILPLKHIHVGCDEVRNINKCPKCKEKFLENTELFVEHVKEVTSIVIKLSPNTKVLIWADMLMTTKKTLQTVVIRNVEAVMWEYSAYQTFSHVNFYNLHKNFNNIWIASAFKGADGRNAIIPHIKNRFQNNLKWMKFILDYKFGGETKVYSFKGIILTGWSRYSHMAPQCELLPVSVPSLILNLLLIKTAKKGIDQGDLQNLEYCEFYKKYLSVEFEEIFKCYNKTNGKCSFENTELTMEYDKIFDLILPHICLSDLHNYESKCSSLGANVDIRTLESSFEKCGRALKKLKVTKKNLQSFMTKYYETQIIKSYVDETVHNPANKIKAKINYLRNCSKVRHWKRRN